MNFEEVRPPASLPCAWSENLVEAAPVGVCVVQDGCIVYGNRWFRDFVGHPASGKLPREVLSVIHQDDRELATRRMQSLLAGQDALPERTVRFIQGDGSVSEIEFSIKIFDYHGLPAIQGILVDITARIDAERNLLADAARLEESNRFHQLFGDILSHDLMNPVWIAENYLRLVMDGGVADNKRSYYEGMRGSLVRARGILADARTYLRLSDVAGAGESIDLGRLVEEVVKSVRPLVEDKGQEISVTLAGNPVISASPLIREVVSQLLSNASKYGPPGSAIAVSVDAGPRVRFAVGDRGPGVHQEDRERIFQRFERMEKGPITGIGLGLAIVRRVVNLHGGSVWVEENPGGGSLFIAEFPAGRT